MASIDIEKTEFEDIAEKDYIASLRKLYAERSGEHGGQIDALEAPTES